MTPSKSIVAVPSFYGLLGFIPGYLIYVGDVIPWSAGSAELHLISGFFMLSLVCATVVQYLVNRAQPEFRMDAEGPSFRLLANCLTGVGILGCLIYVSDISRELGGVLQFVAYLTTNPLLIRETQTDVGSIGLQISYFGWIGAAIYSARLGRGEGGKSEIALVILQIGSNMVFVDRTRPIWVGFTCLIAYLVSRRSSSIYSFLSGIVVLALGSTVFFVAYALFTGKKDDFGGTDLASGWYSLAYYFSCGFAYLSSLMSSHESHSYIPASILSPLFQIGQYLGLLDAPPSRILEFRYLPLPTNVGTALEPFYFDGGYLYLLLGVITYSFGFNALGAAYLRYGGPLGVVAWAHICFAAFIGFFVPKINNPPFWLIAAVGLGGVVVTMARRKTSPGMAA